MLARARLTAATLYFAQKADVEGYNDISAVLRSTAEGKASSVQFIHFPFTAAQAAKFRAPGTEVVVGFGHGAYGHSAIMPEAVRAALSGDLY